MSGSTLIVVAHPKDELISFSSVARAAVIVAATDLPGFEESCTALGANRAIRLGLFSSPRFRLPSERLVEAVRGLGSFERVYTHSPLDAEPAHQDVALAVARVAPVVRVPSALGPFAQLEVLGAGALAKKLEILNRAYAPHLEAAGRCDAPAQAVGAIEAFAEARLEDMMRATSLTHFDRVLDEATDTWGFEQSPYERERYTRSLELIEKTLPREPRRILELGACEGLMTVELARRFPSARIAAVEPNARFAARIRRRAAPFSNIDVIEQSAESVPLTADLIIAAEVLYYLPDFVADMAARIRAGRVFTSYHGPFDAELAALLRRSGFEELARDHVPIRFEPTDGERSPFLVRRVGATLRVFGSDAELD